MRFEWRGSRSHRAVRRFRASLPPEASEAFNERLTTLCRDPRPDRIRKFPSLLGTLISSKYLYRDDQFVMLYEWEPHDEAHAEWEYAVLVLGAAHTDEYESDPMVLWLWW